MMKKLLKDCYYEKSRIWYAAYLGDPRTKIGWFQTERFGPGPSAEPDRHQQNLEIFDWTKGEKNFQISDRVRTKKILKISDLFGPVGPKICQSWIPGEKNLMHTSHMIMSTMDVGDNLS